MWSRKLAAAAAANKNCTDKIIPFRQSSAFVYDVVADDCRMLMTLMTAMIKQTKRVLSPVAADEQQNLRRAAQWSSALWYQLCGGCISSEWNLDIKGICN